MLVDVGSVAFYQAQQQVESHLIVQANLLYYIIFNFISYRDIFFYMLHDLFFFICIVVYLFRIDSMIGEYMIYHYLCGFKR